MIDFNGPAKPFAMHQLRDAQREMFLRADSGKRPDLHGLKCIKLDHTLTTYKLRARARLKEVGMRRRHLINFLTGSVHTQQRRAAAGMAANGSRTCCFCGLGEESTYHIIVECPAWSSLRLPRQPALDRLTAECPPCAYLAGLAPEVDGARHCWAEQAFGRMLDYHAEQVARACSGPSPDSAMAADGWQVAATDGSGILPWHPLLRRAGAGVWWGPDHPRNIAATLQGPVLTAQRAEAMAVLLAVETAWAPTMLLTDSQYARDKLVAIKRCWAHALDGSHADIWTRVQRRVRDRGQHFFRVKWVKGHARLADIEEGRATAAEAHANGEADKLAGQAAELAAPPSCIVAATKQRLADILNVQEFAIDVLTARSSAEPLPLFAFGWTPREQRQVAQVPRAPAPQHDPAVDFLAEHPAQLQESDLWDELCAQLDLAPDARLAS